MWSKIWTEAENSKEGQASWTAWQQQLWTWVTVLFLQWIVWIAVWLQTVFELQTAGRGSAGRRERKTAMMTCWLLYQELQFCLVSDTPAWCFGERMTQQSLNAAFPHCWPMVSSLLSFVWFRSCLNLTWSHINLSAVLTVLLWDYSTKFFNQNCRWCPLRPELCYGCK